MEVVDSKKGSVVIEISSAEWRELSGMFDIIGGMKDAPYWMTEDGDGGLALDENRFLKLYDSWISLVKSEKMRDFF